MTRAIAKQQVCGAVADKSRSRARYLVLSMVFPGTAINDADRAALSIAGTPISRDHHLDTVALGFILSAFGWAFAARQIPSIALLGSWPESLDMRCRTTWTTPASG
jgi:ACS family glucarate transporter-like MFS transporter